MLSMASAHSAHASPVGLQRQRGHAGRAPGITLLGARGVCMQHLHPCHRRSHADHVYEAVSPACVTRALRQADRSECHISSRAGGRRQRRSIPLSQEQEGASGQQPEAPLPRAASTRQRPRQQAPLYRTSILPCIHGWIAQKKCSVLPDGAVTSALTLSPGSTNSVSSRPSMPAPVPGALTKTDEVGPGGGNRPNTSPHTLHSNTSSTLPGTSSALMTDRVCGSSVWSACCKVRVSPLRTTRWPGVNLRLDMILLVGTNCSVRLVGGVHSCHHQSPPSRPKRDTPDGRLASPGMGRSPYRH